MKWIHRPARIEHTKERFDVRDGQFDLEVTESEDGTYCWRCEHHQPVYRDGSFEESAWSSDPESTNWFLLQGAVLQQGKKPSRALNSQNSGSKASC